MRVLLDRLNFNNTVSRDARQRLMALFFLVAFLVGTLVPAAAVFAAEKTPKQKNVAPISEQKAGYETIPQVETLAPVDDSVKAQSPYREDRPAKKVDVTSLTDDMKKEVVDKRTGQSRTYNLEGGGQLTESTSVPQNYTDDNGDLQPIDATPVRDTEYESKNKVNESLWDRVWPGSSQPVGYKAVKGDIQVYFETIGKGGIRVVTDGKELKFAPETDKVVRPQLEETETGEPYILYKDVWPGVDLYYAYQGSAVKEYIRLNKYTGQSVFQFNLEGAKVVKGEDGGMKFDGVFADKLILGDLSINVNLQGPLQEGRPHYAIGNDGQALNTQVDPEWLGSQAKDAFPMVIDPAIYDYTGIPGGDYGEYKPYKSDGYLCPVTSCNVNIGALNSGGLKYWRTMARIPYEHIMGRQLLDAAVYLEMTNMAGWAGYYENRTVWVTWAPCFGIGCTNGGAPHVSGTVGGSGWINVRVLLEWMKNNNVNGGWLIFWGEEWHTTSYKQIRPSRVRLDTYTNLLPSQPNPELPTGNNSTEVSLPTPNPQLRVTPSSDPNGDTVEYYAQVVASNGAGVWGSGWSTIRQWTVPDGVLQDGASYRWEYLVRDPWYTSPVYKGGSFRWDAGTGKDKSQSYDTAGPLNTSLNTGNLYSKVDTHSIGALGGNIGLQLDYNSPLSSRRGLYAQYYNNTNWSGSPVYSRFEDNINYKWDTSSPATGVVNPDNFSAKWSGYFVAPHTGAFTFGSSNDDYVKVAVNDQTVFESGCCQSLAWSGTPVNLTEGQAVKIDVWFQEATGLAYEQLWVKSNIEPVNRVVPTEWLRTAAAAPVGDTGLTGHYYLDNGSHDPAQLTKFMTRQDAQVNFEWGNSSAVPGAPADNFMVRWEGSFTAPTTGSYFFGAAGDDGYRVYANNQLVVDGWAPAGYRTTYAGTSVFLAAGQSIPIKMDYYEAGGWSAAKLLSNGPNGIGPIDSRYLSSSRKVLPGGWNISADADGNLAFERLGVRQNGDVILYDSDGTEHLYASTGSGYKPPVNESGILVKNTNYTYTMTGVDGRVYVFGQNGELLEATSPPDDRKPAALRYDYATRNGMPALTKIVDRVDTSRYGTLVYGDSGQCVTPGGFQAAPANYICAFVTSDGRRTDFLYSNERLARIQLPGGAKYDMGYDSNGMLISVRDVLANDAVASGVRADDASTKTEVTYDVLARVSKTTAPAANEGDNRQQKTYDYGPLQRRWSNPQAITGDLPTGSPNLVNWGPGKLAVFARHGTNELKYRFYESGIWGEWQSLGTCMLDDPGVASWAPNRIDVFIRGCDGQLFTRVYENGAWSNYAGLGGTNMTSSPTATSWRYLRYDVVAKGPNGQVIQRAWTPSTGWTQFYDLGGTLCTAPAVTTWGYDQLSVFAGGCDGASSKFWSKYWQPGWSGYLDETPSERITSAPQAVATLYKKTNVVARGANGELRSLFYNGASWEGWKTLQPCMTGSPAITMDGENTVVVYKGCDSKLYETRQVLSGTTKVHVTGATEPKGYTAKIEYDHLYRTTKSYDNTGQLTSTDWNSAKDLVMSTTGSTGLKSTTIYDDEDRPTHQYGPASAEWFGADRKPLAAYANQVPHTESKYDENITGPSVAWYNAKDKTLFGAPKLHTTGFSSGAATNWLVRNFINQGPQIAPDAGMEGYGFSATGKLRLPGTGTYTIKVFHDDGARLWINDQMIVNDWDYRSEGINQNTNTATFMAEAGKIYRFRMDYYHVGNPGGLTLCIAGSGISDQSCGSGLGTAAWTFLTPSYNLTTSTKTFDSQIGDASQTIGYGSNPELGLPKTTTVDPTGLNLTNNVAYEAPGAQDSLLRPTSKTLPGGTATTYTYYGATETKDNPCTTGTTETYKQAGFTKLKTEADPDGGGSQTARTSEAIYDDVGRTVATRFNNDPWSCATYDSRGRVTETVVPTINGRPGRTVTANFNYQGSPLKVQVVDSIAGTTVSEVDLLGRAKSSTDQFGNVSTVTYDDLGRVSSKTTPMGTETSTYDDYSRPTSYKLDNVTYATVTYDEYSRIQDVTYDQAGGATTQTTTGPGPNLIVNASLETPDASDPNVPDRWYDGAWGTNTYTLSYPNEGRTGSRSAKTEVTNFTDGDAKWYFEPVEVTPNTGYTFKDYYKSNVTTNVVVQFTHQDGSRTYQWVGAPAASSDWAQTTYTFTTPETAARVSVFHIVDRVGWLMLDDAELYVTSQTTTTSTGNGSVMKLEQLKRDNLQRPSGAVFRFSDNTTFDETVVRSQTGKVTSYTDAYDGDSAGGAYTYDKAGRLTAATIDGNNYSYGYGAPSGCSGSYNANAHKNSNRTSFTVNGNTTTYCYDQADRLLTSSDVQLGTPTYDDHGNTVTLAGNGEEITFTYDASDSNIAIEQDGYKVKYVKTDSGSVLRKKEYQGSTLTKSYRYLAGGAILQTCSLTNDNDCTTTDKYISLLGGVTLTLSPTNPDTTKRTIYSISNFHGDTAITANKQGLPTSSVFLYEPFGQASNSTTFGTNSNPGNATDQSMGWASNPTRKVAGAFTLPIIQMGARVYLPTAGRFLQVDPVEGGVHNAYVYIADPINGNDYSGLCAFIIQCTATVYDLQPAAQVQQVQPAAPISRVQASTAPRSRSSTTSVLVFVNPYPWADKVISASGDVASGIKVQSHVYGQQLRQGSSEAGRNLPSVSRIANNPVIRVVGKAGGPLAAGVEFAGNYYAGDSIGDSAIKAGAGWAGGAAGAAFGGVACGTAAAVTLGLGALTCPVLVGVFGAAGSAAGSWVGGKLVEDSFSGSGGGGW